MNTALLLEKLSLNTGKYLPCQIPAQILGNLLYGIKMFQTLFQIGLFFQLRPKFTRIWANLRPYHLVTHPITTIVVSQYFLIIIQTVQIESAIAS